MQYIIPDKAYRIIKWAVLIAMPALATLCGTALPALGVDAGTAQTAVTVITALATFGGALLGVSQVTAKPAGE